MSRPSSAQCSPTPVALTLGRQEQHVDSAQSSTSNTRFLPCSDKQGSRGSWSTFSCRALISIQLPSTLFRVRDHVELCEPAQVMHQLHQQRETAARVRRALRPPGSLTTLTFGRCRESRFEDLLTPTSGSRRLSAGFWRLSIRNSD